MHALLVCLQKHCFTQGLILSLRSTCEHSNEEHNNEEVKVDAHADTHNCPGLIGSFRQDGEPLVSFGQRVVQRLNRAEEWPCPVDECS